ncbi:hypothetical protein [Bifidobacterium breve]|nr:hypothetical protein [Bifidobacterium breve]MBK5036665.1 hypothetical protein [Bifidobacterium breve]MCZ4443551.1 hypothetical protein [Bifidobacterium breve]MCZ4445341.1 hypothetical protein [Bifidobacterium breve]
MTRWSLRPPPLAFAIIGAQRVISSETGQSTRGNHRNSGLSQRTYHRAD